MISADRSMRMPPSLPPKARVKAPKSAAFDESGA